MASFYLVIFFLFCTGTWSLESCNTSVAGPLSVPIRNVSLSSSVVRRGVAISVGTPPQDLAFQVELHANNTFLYDQSGQCDASTTSNKCLTFRGGAFDESSSTTWSTTSKDAAPEIADINTSKDILGHDTIHLNSTTNIDNFPIYIPRSSIFDMNALGFGQGSTILNGLRNAGTIASKSFSVWYGLVGAQEADQMDGSLVIGGYDAAKATGKNHTEALSLNTNCPTGILAEVTDISMDLPNGSKQSIIGNGLTIQMCIDPGYELITIPESVWNNFQTTAAGTNIGRSFGLNVWGELYLASNVYQGGISFTFSSGLEISIPNEQLVVPDLTIDSSGSIGFNQSTREIMLNSLQAINANDLPLLGMSFLTSAYLHVNQDEKTFTLWQANPTTDEKLVAVGSSINGCGDSTGAGGAATTKSSGAITSTSTNHPSQTSLSQNTSSPSTAKGSSSASKETSSPSSNSFSSSHLSPGAIAGIVCGIFSSIALTAVIVVLFFLKKRRRNISFSWRSDPPEYDDGKSLTSATGGISFSSISKHRSASSNKIPYSPNFGATTVPTNKIKRDDDKYTFDGEEESQPQPQQRRDSNDSDPAETAIFGPESYEMWNPLGSNGLPSQPTQQQRPRTQRFELSN